MKKCKKELTFSFFRFLIAIFSIAIVCLVIYGLHGAIEENHLDWGQLHAYDTILLPLLNSKKKGQDYS